MFCCAILCCGGSNSTTVYVCCNRYKLKLRGYQGVHRLVCQFVRVYQSALHAAQCAWQAVVTSTQAANNRVIHPDKQRMSCFSATCSSVYIDPSQFPSSFVLPASSVSADFDMLIVSRRCG